MDDEHRTGALGARRGRVLRTGVQYEYRTLAIPRTTSGNDARKMLADEAEYGRWELTRTRLYAGGERRVLLRRKIIRARSTLPG